MEIVNIVDHFHFLRPWWLLFIPLWLVLSYRVWHTQQQQNGWSSLCDPALLSYLLGESGKQKSASKTWFVSLFMAGFIASLALAGPVWKQLPQPIFQATSAMILILDLSRSMDAEDIKPSRLVRAKQKIQDILAARKEGQTGLIVFAGSAFDVVPLSTDNQAILSLLASLDTSMMPAQGSLASLALERAAAMFQRGAIQAGSVVMLCDGLDDQAVAAAQQLADAGHRVSILAVGTTDGAPIPARSNQINPSLTGGNQSSGGFLKDSSGNIVLPRINESHLVAVTAAGNGVFQYIRLDDNDVMQLPGLIPSHFSHSTAMQDSKTDLIHTDQWFEEGPWLVLLLLPLCALAFRRGLLLLLLLIPLLTAVSLPTTSQAMAWNDLWQTPDQQAQRLMHQDKASTAASRFEDPAWKAAALYRAGRFDEAAQALANREGAENQYNKANALARAGKLQEALKSYDAALKSDASNQDAQFNRELVEKALKKQQQKNNNNDNKKPNQHGDKQSPQKQAKQSDDPSNKQDKEQAGKQGQQPPQKPSKSSPPDKQDSQSASDDLNKQGQEKQSKKDQTQASSQDKEGRKKPEEDAQKSNVQQSDLDPAVKKEAKNQASASDQQASEKQRAQQQLLRRIPDDPGGLLRRKFKYQYQNQDHQSGSQQAW